MAFYLYSCDSCSTRFEIRSEPGGAPPPGSVPCNSCGTPAARVWGAGLQVRVRNKEFDYTSVGAQPVDRRLSAGRNAKQAQKAAEKLIGAKARVAQRERRMRGTSRSKGGIRQIGSIDMRELNAIRAQTGNRHIVRDEGIESVLRRAGKHFDHP